jgi:Na+/melibiose symporter-like transporter
MTPMLALSGGAKEAANFTLYGLASMVLVIAALLCFALFRKSARARVGAGVLAVLSGVLFNPFVAFLVTPVDRNTMLPDPEYVAWQKEFRIVGVFWAIAFVAALALIVHHRRRKHYDPPAI